MNMSLSVILACAVLVAVVQAEAPAESGPYPASSGPYPPSGWRPSGQLLVLPARQVSSVYGPPTQEYGPPSDKYGPPATEAPTEAQPTEPTTSDAPEAAEEVTEAAEESEQLREGGIYYVLTQDGRLQMVRYHTSPLKSQRQQKAPSAQRAKQQLSQIQAHQAQFQPKPARLQQQPAKSSQKTARANKQAAQINQQPQPFHFVEIQKSQEIEVAQPPPQVAPNGFVANLQYRNVEPINAPVFAFNNAPLTRIVKK